MYDLSCYLTSNTKLNNRASAGKWISAYRNYIDFINSLIDTSNKEQSLTDFSLEYEGEYDSLIKRLRVHVSDRHIKSIISNFVDPIGIINIGQNDVIDMIKDSEDLEVSTYYGDDNNIQDLAKRMDYQIAKYRSSVRVMMQIFVSVNPKISTIDEIVTSTMYDKDAPFIYGVVVKGSYPPGFIKVVQMTCSLVSNDYAHI